MSFCSGDVSNLFLYERGGFYNEKAENDGAFVTFIRCIFKLAAKYGNLARLRISDQKNFGKQVHDADGYRYGIGKNR